MKNLFYSPLTAAIVAALTFSACTDQEVIDDQAAAKAAAQAAQDDNSIQFGTYMGNSAQTRAGATGAQTTTTLQTNGFGVFAYNTGANTWSSAGASTAPNFMYNQSVTYSSSTWSYSPVKYWPNGKDAANSASSPSNTATESGIQYLSFYAYGPHANSVELSSTTYTLDPATGKFKNGDTDYSTVPGAFGITALTSNTTNGDPKVTYNLASTSAIGSNVDLLWGVAPAVTYDETDGTDTEKTAGDYNTDLTKQSTAETVDFVFKHALAKIADSYTGLKVVLDVDANSDAPTTAGSGSLDANSVVTIQDITIQNKANSIALQGVFNLATGAWSDTSLGTVSAGAAININITPSTENVNGAIMAAADDATYSTEWSNTGVTTSPQAVYTSSATPAGFYLIPGIASQVLIVSVTYQITTKDANVNGGYVRVNQTITNEVTLPSLEVNKYYDLIMHLGLTSVKFSATVSNWDAAGDSNTQVIWLPSNVVVGS